MMIQFPGLRLVLIRPFAAAWGSNRAAMAQNSFVCARVAVVDLTSLVAGCLASDDPGTQHDSKRTSNDDLFQGGRSRWNGSATLTRPDGGAYAWATWVNCAKASFWAKCD